MIPNTGVIIGGGYSLKEGIELGLWDKIENTFAIGTNYSYKYFNSTLTTFVDRDFFNKQREELSKLPLIIGASSNGYIPTPNLITLSTSTRYSRNLSSGVFAPELCGIFSLSLMIYLMDKGTIYLLGYDMGAHHTKNVEDTPLTLENKDIMPLDDRKRPLTHFYQGELKQRGVGKVSYYNAKNRPRDKFIPFVKDGENEKKIKIFNVSPNSRIPSSIIEKIGYGEFFERLGAERPKGEQGESETDSNHIEQDKMRREIRKKLNS